MNNWVIALGWFSIYLAAEFMVPSKKKGRGYITRLLGRTIPPRRFWVPPNGVAYRYWLVLIPAETLLFTHVVGDKLFAIIFWPILIGLYIDDYLNGGDDWKKRWESVKNKIRWKMELPTPVTHDVGGA